MWGIKLGIITLVILAMHGAVHAGGVGYIDYNKVLLNYQYAKISMTEVENKSIEIEKYVENKENEYDKTESAVQKKKIEDSVRNEMPAKEKAFQEFKAKKEEDVYNRIHAVSEKIRMEKGLDAIIDIRSVFSGGVDITDDLIKKLNEK